VATQDKNFRVKNGIDAGSTITTTSGDIVAAGILKSNNSAVNEGGEIQLALPSSGSTLSTNVVIDVYQNRLRIFEAGGTTRGAYIDLSAATAGVGSNLLAGGGSSPASPTVAGIVLGLTEDLNQYLSNAAIGRQAGLYMPSQSGSTFVGTKAGFQFAAGVTSAAELNTGIGNSSLASLTTGAKNVGVGYDSLYSTTTGSHNVAIGGEDALFSNITGSHNIAIGTLAGYNSKSNSNVFIGGFAGDSITTGSNNIIIGRDADGSSATVSNEVTIGNASINRFRVPGLGIDWTSSNVPIAPQDIIPLDDISNEFNGSTSRFIPKYQGSQVTISNPFRLLLTINGIMQYIDSPDYVWMSGVSRRGFFVDNDGQLQFSEAVPAGSEFDARLMPGAVTTTRTRTYPFKALDILLGG